MNKICESCDTRIRLGLCGGRAGNFRYCFRDSGPACWPEEERRLKGSITPFNKLEELYNSPAFNNRMIRPETMRMAPYSKHIMLLMGKYAAQFGDDMEYPLGYIIA